MISNISFNYSSNCYSYKHITTRFENIELWSTSSVMLCVFNGITMFSAVLGNAVILTVFWKTTSFHKPANILLCSLAVTDFLTGLLTQPSFLVYSMARLTYRYEMYCIGAVFYSNSSYVLSIASFLTLTAVGFDKFVALTLHLRYDELVTNTKMKLLAASLWLLAVAGDMINVFARKLFRYISVIIMAIVFISNATAYVKVFRIIWKHKTTIKAQKQLESQKERRKTRDWKKFEKSVFSMFGIVVLYFGCYTPFLGVTVAATLVDSSSWRIREAKNIASSIIWMNSSINPLFYCWRITEIRQAVIKLFKKIRVEVQNEETFRRTFGGTTTHVRRVTVKENVEH